MHVLLDAVTAQGTDDDDVEGGVQRTILALQALFDEGIVSFYVDEDDVPRVDLTDLLSATTSMLALLIRVVSIFRGHDLEDEVAELRAYWDGASPF